MDNSASWGDRRSPQLHPHVYADNPAPKNRNDALRILRQLKATLRDIATEQRLRRAERLAQGINPDTDPVFNEWYARSCKAYKGADRHRRAIEVWLDADDEANALRALEANPSAEPTVGEVRYLMCRMLDALIADCSDDGNPNLHSELVAIRRIMHLRQAR